MRLSENASNQKIEYSFSSMYNHNNHNFKYRENGDRYIYIMLSKTQTKFAKCIRKIGRQEYNHAAVSLDDDLSAVYAFSRPQHNAVLLGRLVRESIERYTLGRDGEVPVVVFRVPVTESEYYSISCIIENMLDNPDYMYNLFSVLTYPVTKGFATYKAFTCIEFVAYVMSKIGYLQEKPYWRYKPDDLLTELDEKIVYRGDIRKRMSAEYTGPDYFAPFTWAFMIKSVTTMCRLIARTCNRKYH